MFRTLCCLFLLGLTCNCYPENREAAGFPDRLEILGLLENRQYSELQGLVESAQRAYEAGKGKEETLQFIVETLANSAPGYEPLINQWLREAPANYVPHLVRAWYYYGLALSWRGLRSEVDTVPARLQKMREILELAAADLNDAIAIKPRLSVADSLAIKLLMLLDGRDYMTATLNEALQLNPDSLLVRTSYIRTLKPEWGGKSRVLIDFIESVKSASEEYPHLGSLLGYADYIFAAALVRRKRFAEAAQHFDFAVANGADYLIYRERGKNYYRLEEFERARENLDISLELWPQDGETLRWRSYTYQKLGRQAAALADLDLATRLEPMNKSILMSHARLLRKMKQYEQVMMNYDQALVYNPDDADIWYQRGLHLSHELLNFPAAEENFRRATQLAPERPEYWYEYAAVLHYNLDCGIVDPLSRYVALCASGEPCNPGELKWARDAQAWLEESRRCDNPS